LSFPRIRLTLRANRSIAVDGIAVLKYGGAGVLNRLADESRQLEKYAG